MHDRNGTPVKVGDIVMIPGRITQLVESTPDYCNVSVESVHGRRPDGMKEYFCINTGVLVLYERQGDYDPTNIHGE
jgi:hypothetical protein